MKRRADFRRPENFWEEKGDMILAVARYMGLPFYEMNEDMPAGIPFCQVRYRARKGKKQEKEKTKWLTDKPLKKKQEILALCLWTIFPVGIYPAKRSLDPKEQRYGYLVRISDKEGQTLCSAMIEVRWDGAVVKQTVDIGKERTQDIREEIPIGLRYPKVIFAKLNHCMARFFWSDLWCGPMYAAWYRPEDSIAIYMGDTGESQEAWTNGLKPLLQSQYGDAVAVLLSYVCFSILRPWFDDYPSLNNKSPYFEVKKKLPLLLALNAQSKDMKSAEELAQLCCGAFQNMGDGTLSIYDGVALQKFPKRYSPLSEGMFEKKVLQSSSILWVNRKLAKEVKQKNRVLNLQVPSGFDKEKYKFKILDMIRALTETISAKDREMKINIMEKDRKRQTQVAVKTLNSLRKLEKKYNFEFQEVEIVEEFARLQQDIPTEGLVNQFADVRGRIHTEIITEAEFDVDNFDSEAKKVFSDCLREMRKIHKENCARGNFLEPYYMGAQQDIRGVDGIKSIVASKVIFLWAAAKFFITLFPEGEQPWIKQKIFRALADFAKQQKEPWSASEYLRNYLMDEIRGGRCARIRGEGSDDENITLWYDPHAQLFLLPAKTYFDNMHLSTKEPQITRRIFEKKLTEEGVLLTVKRRNQLRRSFEVKTRRGAPSILALKVPLAQYWQSFRQYPKIKEALRQFHQERTPLREH